MNRLTEEFLENEIKHISYTRLTGTLTHCAITVKNGFVFTGESACVDESDYEREIGKKVAFSNAFEKMWMPYGFYLKQKNGGDFMFRLQNERDELAERCQKLEAFLSTDKFNHLDDKNRELLREQLYVMGKYLSVLNARLDIANSK